MINQDRFIEMIEDVTTLAKLNNRVVTVDFLTDYFKDLNLDSKQMTHVYTYLTEHNINVTGYDKTPDEEGKKEKQAGAFQEKDEAESEYLNIYLNEVNKVKADKISIDAFRKMLDGDEKAKEEIVNSYLPKVISCAKEYRSKGLSQSDLIQEGNIGLLLGLTSITGSDDIKKIESILDSSIRESMLQAIDELSDHRKNSRHIIKKADKIKEKAEELDKSMNSRMTMEEMAEYMEMDLSEIEDILRITGDEL